MMELLLVVPSLLFGTGVGLFAGRRRATTRPENGAGDTDSPFSPTGMTANRPSDAPDWLIGCLESVDHVALRVCETTQALCGRTAAAVLRDPIVQTAAVVAVSQGVDKRLVQVTISPESPAGRACIGVGGLVDSAGDSRVLGGAPTVRRREQHGVALPLRSGEKGVGALVVFGPPESLGADNRRKLTGLACEAGPILDRALMHRAEAIRERVHPVIGIPNRRGLTEAISARTYPPCTLVRLELDSLNAIAAQFGEPAADGACRHAARLFERCLRDDDVPAYLEGPSFAMLLIECSREGGEVVARRLSQSLTEVPFRWNQLDFQLTCSVGIASVPDMVSTIDQLELAAEEALRAQV